MKRLPLLVAALLFVMPVVAQASQTFHTWTFYTVDDPVGTTTLTGIDDTRQIVGYLNTGAAVDANEPGWIKWYDVSYPGASYSKAFAIANDGARAGIYSNGSTVQGYMRMHKQDQGAVYTTWPYAIYGVNPIHCGPNGGNHCHTNKLEYGPFIVGPYSSTQGYVINTLYPTQYTYLQPPYTTTATATAYDESGDVAGDFNNGIWVLPFKKSYKLFSLGEINEIMYNENQSSPSAVTIHANAMNFQGEIAGTFVDTKGASHGYILTWKPQFVGRHPVIQVIDEPNGFGSTIVNGINDHHDIDGTYKDSASQQHGFVAIATKQITATPFAVDTP